MDEANGQNGVLAKEALNMTPTDKESRQMNSKRLVAAQKLLDAAHKFWKACHEEGQHGAVQWLIGTNGELIIFTRGEYRETLMSNIETLIDQKRIHKFSGEVMLAEDDDE